MLETKILVVDDELYSQTNSKRDLIPEETVKILFGEDIQRTRERVSQLNLKDILIGLFKGKPYQLFFASNYEEAERLLREHRDIEILLTDIRMPHVDGFQLIELLRAINPDLEAILLTAYGSIPKYRKKALESGVFGFVDKPIELNKNKLFDAIERAQRNYERRLGEKVKRELAIARNIQMRLNPTPPRDIGGIEFSCFYNPADHIGGDSYAITLFSDGTIGIMVADVSGHGISSAVINSAFVKASESLSKTLNDPERIVKILWRCFYAPLSEEDRFITALYAKIDPKERILYVVNAGHPNPIIYRPSEDKFLEVDGDEYKVCPIGVLPFESIEKKRISSPPLRLQEGDILLFYTDGILEQYNKDEEKQFKDVRNLYDLVKANRKSPLSKLPQEIYRSFIDFKGAMPQEDDITLLALRITPYNKHN